MGTLPLWYWALLISFWKLFTYSHRHHCFLGFVPILSLVSFQIILSPSAWRIFGTCNCDHPTRLKSESGSLSRSGNCRMWYKRDFRTVFLQTPVGSCFLCHHRNPILWRYHTELLGVPQLYCNVLTPYFCRCCFLSFGDLFPVFTWLIMAFIHYLGLHWTACPQFPHLFIFQDQQPCADPLNKGIMKCLHHWWTFSRRDWFIVSLWPKTRY